MFGIDVSHHNGRTGKTPGAIDWVKVAQNTPKVDFAYIKATEGQDFEDKMLYTNAIKARGAGIPIGFYHFASLNTFNFSQDAAEEARDFISAIKRAGPAKLPPVLDIEKNVAGLPKVSALAWIKVFMAEMKKAGFNDVVIYSYSSFLSQLLPVGHGLGNHKLWLAGYVAESNLQIPHGWTKYWLWQYSQTGKVSGIGSNVDLNKSNGPIF